MAVRMFMLPSQQDELLAQVESRFARSGVLRQQAQADPGLVTRAASMAQMYGSYVPAAALLTMARSGLDPDSDLARRLAEMSGRAVASQPNPEPGETVNTGVLGTIERQIKAGIRGGFATLSAPIEEFSAAVSALGTAALDTDPRFNPVELYTEQAAGSTLRNAITSAGRFAQENQAGSLMEAHGLAMEWGEEALGTGFLPSGSTREQREVEKERLQLGGHFVTPGRLVPAIINRGAGREVIEPGSRAWHIGSGIVDFAFNVAADPTSWLLAGSGAASRAARTFGLGIEDLPRSARAMAAVGLIRGPRRAALGETVMEFLQREQGAVVRAVLRDTDNPARIMRGFDYKIEPRLADELAATTDDAKIMHLLATEVLGPLVSRKPLPGDFRPGLSERTIGTSRLPGVRRDLHGVRFLQDIPHQLLDHNNPRALVRDFDLYLRNAKLAPDLVDQHASAMVRAAGSGNSKNIKAAFYDANQSIIDEVLGRYGQRRLTASRTMETLPDGTRVPRDDRARALVKHMAGQGAEFQREARTYLLDTTGGHILPPGSKRFYTLHDGTKVPMEGGTAYLLAHARDDVTILPDVRAIRREISWMAPLWDTPVLGGLTDGAVRLLSAAQSTIWKPLTLLRLAYIMRVMPDEQARMAAAGDYSMFRHPFQWFTYAFGGASKSKAIDASGNRLADFNEHIAAMTPKTRIVNADGTSLWGVTETGDYFPALARNEVTGKPEPGAIRDWSDYLGKFAMDPIGREVAGAGLGRNLDRVKADLRAGGRLHHEVTELKRLDVTDLDTDAKIDTYVDGLWEGITTAVGGDLRHGRVGSTELLHSLSRGEIAGVAVNAASPNYSGVGAAFGEAADGLRGYADEFLPNFLPRPRMEADGAKKAKDAWDTATNFLFEWIAGRPFDRLSRHPVYAQRMWKEYARVLPYTDQATAAKIVEGARKAGIPDRDVQRIVRAAAKPGTGVLTDMARVDQLAHAAALDATKELLYDLTTKGQWADVLRTVSPFAEAWREVITTWGRLVRENPSVVRRGQQAVEGARGAGFFYVDEHDEEKFAYPGGDWLARLAGVTPPGQQVDLTGRVEGLNMVAQSWLPGLGPVASVAAGALLPEKPSVDWIRDLILPFGEPEAATPGEWIDSVLPAYMKRAVTAMRADPDSDRMFNSTMIESMRMLVATGDYTNDMGLVAQDDQIRLEADAIKYAKGLSWLRAAAQFVVPTGPIPSYSVDTPEGLMRTDALSRELRNMQDEHGFEGALEAFVERFGFDVALSVQAKSQQINYLPASREGYAWQIDNAELIRDHRSVAGFFAPLDPDDGLDLRAWTRAIDMGDRISLTPQQVLLRHNKTLGRLAVEHAERSLGDQASTSEGRALLARIRQDMREQYPGFGTQSGMMAAPDTERLIADLARAADDPRLRDTGVAQGIREWMDIRRAATTAVRAMPYNLRSFSRSRRPEVAAIRDWMRDEGRRLIEQYPEFSAVFSRVYERELRVDDAVEEVAA